jgi:predicted TIM-barrel fold metal-dependent hydrolase
VPNEAWVFDFDNHYYESPDAFTRHQDRSLGYRGVRWVDVDGRRRLIVGGTVNSYIANPTFNPVARPGALFDWYRGNPRQQDIREAFGELEPLRPEYQDREQRLKVMDAQGLVGAVLFPTIGVGIEDALKNDPESAAKVFHGFNRWLDEDWGFHYENRIFAAPYIPMLDPEAAVDELQQVLDAGAIVINIRNGPVPVPGGWRSPFEPIYDRFWGLAEEANITVAAHSGVDGYDILVQMWEHGGPESSLFRSPLRGALTKGRAVTDFFLAALCQLLFERFPLLRMASVESGAAWVPDVLHRVDDAANRNPGYFAEHPREVFGEHVWVTPFWEDDVPTLLGDMRIERLLLGSDWPHAEGTREPTDFITEALGGLSEGDIRRIGRENALELLGLSYD